MLMFQPVAHAAAGGSTGATFLELGIGARAAAMGHAMTAWADDVYGMHFNPAGIAGARRQQVGFAHNTLVLDLDYNYLAYLHPFQDGSALAISGLYVDLGSVDRYEIVGGVPTALGKASGNDFYLAGTYGRRVTPWLDLGVTLKFINETLDRYDAQAVAVDLGTRWHPPVPGLTLGLSLSNLGTRLKFVDQRDELPLTLRVGAGFRPEGGRWGMTGDVVYVKNQEFEGAIGAEVWVVPKMIVLRAGATSASDAGSGLTVGTGFLWNDIGVDYAYVPFGDLGDQHLISLGYQFGPDRGERTRRVPPPARPVSRPVEPTHPPAWEVPTPRMGVAVRPFVMRAGGPDEDWIGPATSEVLARAWSARGIMTPPSATPEIVIDGEYWVADGKLIMTGAVALPDGSARTVFASGLVANPFEVWNGLRGRIEALLTTIRPEWRFEAPAARPTSPPPAPAPIPTPAPLAAPAPLPAPAAPPVVEPVVGAPGVAISVITDHGTGRETEKSRRLVAELAAALSRLGVTTDPARAVARFEAQYAEMDGERLVIYGRVIDRATGISLGTVEIHGSSDPSRLPADRLADAILMRLPVRP